MVEIQLKRDFLDNTVFFTENINNYANKNDVTALSWYNSNNTFILTTRHRWPPRYFILF